MTEHNFEPDVDMKDTEYHQPNDSAVSLSPQPCPEAPCAGPNYLMQLPQELLDIIFDLSYGFDSERAIVTRSGFARNEADRIRRGTHSYTSKSFPAPKVDDFLVSKDFFINAAKAWFAVQTWNRGPKMSSSLFKSGLYYEFGGISLVEPGRSSVHSVVACKRLREVNTVLTPAAFDEATPKKFAWLDVLDEEDFDKLSIVIALKRARGLKKLTVKAGSCPYINQKREVWLKNVAALRDYLWPIVSGPKEKSKEKEQEAGTFPLYEGSRVCYDQNELLPEDYYLGRGKKGRKYVVAEKYRKGKEENKEEIAPETFEELAQRTEMSAQEVWRLIQEAGKRGKGEDEKERLETDARSE